MRIILDLGLTSPERDRVRFCNNLALQVSVEDSHINNTLGASLNLLISVPEMPTSPLNAALAAENMILQATGLGLGSCFLFSPTLALNSPANKALAAEAGIPEDYKLQCVVIVGHADAQNKFSAVEREPKGSVTYVD